MPVQEISAKQAFEKLQNQNCALIDVRTDAEFIFVGQVDLSCYSKEVVLLPWKIFPNMNLNGRFQISLDKILQEKFQDKAKQAELIFMCRSGARSFEAANYMADFGYENCYNLTSGFEGDLDSQGHRGKKNGWKANNLPWRQ